MSSRHVRKLLQASHLFTNIHGYHNLSGETVDKSEPQMDYEHGSCPARECQPQRGTAIRIPLLEVHTRTESGKQHIGDVRIHLNPFFGNCGQVVMEELLGAAHLG